jgi:hypothetical protein
VERSEAGAAQTLVTKEERENRLKAARIAMGRDDAPIIYFTATPQGECDFPTLFKSRAERVVRLIENPPQLRPNGFEIWADKTAPIIHGRLRRNMLAGHRLLELWKDGLFIFIAPGDEDFLGWAVSGGPDKPIRISNFVLAEATLMFCWLVQQIFEEANPKPSTIRLSIGIDNMTRDVGPASLRNIPEGKIGGLGGPKLAPGPEREVSELAAWDDYDPAHLAYLLVEHIFHWFGYESQDIPFVDKTGSKPRLSAQLIIEKPLPVGIVPAPDYY